MDRSNKARGILHLLTSRRLPTKLIASAIAGAGCLGAAWCLTQPVTGAVRLLPRASIRVAAPVDRQNSKVRYDDITRMLEDDNPAVRLEAMKYLEVLTRPSGELISLLGRHFNDPDQVVRIQAVYSAIRLGMPAEKGVSIAEPLLVPTNPRVCCMASQVLGLAGSASRDALPQLRACFTSSSVWVPLHAARAAVRIDCHEASDLSPSLQAAPDQC